MKTTELLCISCLVQKILIWHPKCIQSLLFKTLECPWVFKGEWRSGIGWSCCVTSVCDQPTHGDSGNFEFQQCLWFGCDMLLWFRPEIHKLMHAGLLMCLVEVQCPGGLEEESLGTLRSLKLSIGSSCLESFKSAGLTQCPKTLRISQIIHTHSTKGNLYLFNLPYLMNLQH